MTNFFGNCKSMFVIVLSCQLVIDTKVRIININCERYYSDCNTKYGRLCLVGKHQART